MKLPWQSRSSLRSREAVDVGCSWRPFSYSRVRQSPLRLSILRLDGTSFDVCVQKKASVKDLKKAVEEYFSGKNGDLQVDVSWSVVWGHFSLCYKNYNLKDPKTKLKVLGIKDGDKVEFMRNSDLRPRRMEDDQ